MTLGSENKTTAPAETAQENHKFASDIIWFSVAQLFISVILGVITLPALTKSYASEIYGIWIQVSVTVDLISPIISLQLGLAAVKFLAGEQESQKRRRALGAMISAIALFAIAVSAGGVIFARQLSIFLFNSPEYVSYVSLLIGWVSFNALFNFFISYLRARSRIREVSIIQVSLIVLKMIAILSLAYNGLSLETIIAGMILLQAAFAVFILVLITREVGFPVLTFFGLRQFLAFSLPQIPAITLLWIISMSDRYFITHFLGLSENGIYSSSFMIGSLTSLIYMPISFALFPMLSKLKKENRPDEVKSYLQNSMKFFLTMAIPAAIGITVISQPLLRLLTTSEFMAGEEIVFLLAFGAILLGVYNINISLILVEKKAKLLPIVTASACVTSVTLNIILIPRTGIIGAAISNFSSYFLLATISTLWAKRATSYSLNFVHLSKVAVSASAMLLALMYLKFDSAWGIVLDTLVGLAVFGTGLIMSRAFSSQDMRFIGKTFVSLVSREQA
ncbi:MAG: oligosaccharide flippase family protein [Dehalococcoidales bacterium]|nr:oligosaccharide flippase family protein [Dehalococcoidales bacterium]